MKVLRKKVTMNDIAERLGVSTVSVSNALSGKSGVSPNVRDEIFRLANELGYVYQKATPKQDGEVLDGCDIGILTAQRYIQISSILLLGTVSEVGGRAQITRALLHFRYPVL